MNIKKGYGLQNVSVCVDTLSCRAYNPDHGTVICTNFVCLCCLFLSLLIAQCLDAKYKLCFTFESTYQL